MRVLILMSTYQGGAFLDEQVASIRAQSHEDWRLLVRDDGSSDDTLARLRRLADADPRVRYVTDDAGNLGPAGSFARLMELALAEPEEAIAFADHDDRWQPDKLRYQLDALRRLDPETRRGPLLVHSDLALMDAQGNELGECFSQRQRIRRPAEPPLSTQLLQNHVVGCTLLINRALLRLATPVPTCAHMHDWWLALCAAAAGRRVYLPEPLVSYRLHGGNQVGARGAAGLARAPAAWLRKMARIHRTAFAQAAALRERLRVIPSAAAGQRCQAARATLERMLALRDRPGPGRVVGLLRLGARCQHPALTALVYLQTLLVRPVTDDPGPGS